VLFAENPAWAEGLASSIRAGMGTMQQFSRRLDAVLVALGTSPRFLPTLSPGSSPASGAAAAASSRRATAEGRVRPPCFSPRTFPGLGRPHR